MNQIPATPIDLSPIIAKYFPDAKAPVVRLPVADADKSFFQRVNDHAMGNLGAWVPELLPTAERARGGYRVRSVDLGRQLEEDLSIQPEGIVDFGVHDQGDEREGKRTPLELVREHSGRTVAEAALWLCEQLAIAPATLGWRDEPGVPLTADEFAPLEPRVAGVEEPPGFERNKGGQILATLENVRRALTAPAFTGWRLAFDTFLDATMLAPAGTTEWRPLTDADYTMFRLALETRDFKPVSKELIRDVVEYVAIQLQFDSAQLWLGTLRHDGVSRVETFLPRYFGTADTQYTRAVSKYIWTALAGRVVEPGVQADMMPILVGAQGAGKTSGVKAMVVSLDHFFELDMAAKEDDTSRRMRGRLVGEIGELRGLHTKEIEHIKAFITRTQEDWVPKFREHAIKFKRRCLFIGTTNGREFLADDSGERRFLPVDVGQVDRDAITADREQLWAEARDLFAAGGVQWQEAESLAKLVHEDYKIIDTWAEPVERWLVAMPEFNSADEVPVANGARPFTMSDLLAGLGFDAKATTQAHAKRAGAVLRRAGYVNKPRRVDGVLKKVWVKES